MWWDLVLRKKEKALKLLKKYNFRLDETYYVNDSELDLNNINDLISMLKSFLSECSEINESI